MTKSAASPALNKKSEHYPANYRGRVPKKIKMAKTVYPDLPWMPGIKPGTMLELNQTYYCWVNTHGAVAGWCDNGEKLGVKPSEFDVVEWHETEPHNEIKDHWITRAVTILLNIAALTVLCAYLWEGKYPPPKIGLAALVLWLVQGVCLALFETIRKMRAYGMPSNESSSVTATEKSPATPDNPKI